MVNGKTLNEMFTDLTNAKFRADEIAAKKKYEEETKNYRDAFSFIKNVVHEIVSGKFGDKIEISRDFHGEPSIKFVFKKSYADYDTFVKSIDFIRLGVERKYNFESYVTSKFYRYYKSKEETEEKIHTISMVIDGLMIIINKSESDSEIGIVITKVDKNEFRTTGFCKRCNDEKPEPKSRLYTNRPFPFERAKYDTNIRDLMDVLFSFPF